MIDPQAPSPLRMEDGDGELKESLTSQTPGDIIGDIARAGQLPQSRFGRQLPGGGSADPDLVVFIADDVAPWRDSRRSPSSHQSNVWVSSSSRTPLLAPRGQLVLGQRVEERSRHTRTPCMAPNSRFGFASSRATSFATRCDPRAITMVSPRLTLAISRESCVLAA
jgi:hypothetical protein